jgi:iron complex outermembrane recepter protein
VINIITRPAGETHGGLAALSAGTAGSQPAAFVRQGGRLGSGPDYRVYVKYLRRDALVDSAGNESPDSGRNASGGFRLDWGNAGDTDQFTLQGDAYDGEAGKRLNLVSLSPAGSTPLDPPEQNHGLNVLGRYSHVFANSSALMVQAYYDHVAQGEALVYGREHRDTGDVEIQHRFTAWERNDVLWGAGYRYTEVENSPTFNLTWTPERQELRLANLFIQDDYTIEPGRWHAIVGSKFEHNNLTGWEVQPNARLLWMPTAEQTVWAAASRATRTPSLFERTARLNVAAFETGGPPVLVSFLPNPDFRAEKLTAYELGYRIKPLPTVFVDLAGFYNVYTELSTAVPNPPRSESDPPPSHNLISSTWQNANGGNTFGAEVSADWQATDRLRLEGSYTCLKSQLDSEQVGTEEQENSPRHQFQVRSRVLLAEGWELNTAAYWVGAIQTPSGDSTAHIPAYLRLDVGVIWRPRPDLDIALIGQNLADDQHAEFASQQSSLITEIPRSAAARVLWRF